MATTRHQTTGGNRTPVRTMVTAITNLMVLQSISIHVVSSSPFSLSTRTFLPSNSTMHRHFRNRFDEKTDIIPAHSSSASDEFLQSNDDRLLERLRGGSFLGGNNGDAKSLSRPSGQGRNVAPTNNSRDWAVKAGGIAFTAAAILLSVQHWDTIKLLFDKEKLRKSIIQRLNGIASQGNKGLLIYACGFVFWEVFGLPTSVVETAAGMAFGFSKGLLGSFVGKTCGSILAFTLGRTLLSDIAGRKMEKKESFGLIERNVAHNPMLSAFVVRYSPFPQLIKNFALSITKPVTYPIFIIAIVVHGFPFSLLWAALGNDSSLRLRAAEMGEKIPANVILNGLLVFVTIFGCVVSPAITGLWLANMSE